ncbi:substrate-binding periplasmic protein [Radicibacter daui]|uniref:substrate-binding periplasmic protein n=1 Tax=Radicibacter daui TaxID=3064829 RepID=UPI004046DF44
MRIVLLLWLFLTLGLPATPALAQNSIEDGVTILFDENAHPLAFAGKNHVADGLYPRMVAEAFRRMKVPVRLEAVPWTRALMSVDAGAAGIGGLYQTEQRLQHYDYSDPIYEERVLLYFRADHPVVFEHIRDLDHLRIGVMRGWAYCPGFDKARAEGRLTADTADNDDQNLAKLAAGRIDAMLMVEPQDGSLPAPGGLQLGVAARPIAENSVYIAFDKKAGKTDLIAHFNQAIEEMKTDGTYGALVAEVKAPARP